MIDSCGDPGAYCCTAHAPQPRTASSPPTAAASSARAPIIEGMKARTLHQPYDADQLDHDIRDGVCSVVRQQVAAGIDVPNDGEYTRRGFTSYIHERLAGLESVETSSADLDQTGHRRERDDFPDFYAQYDRCTAPCGCCRVST